MNALIIIIIIVKGPFAVVIRPEQHVDVLITPATGLEVGGATLTDSQNSAAYSSLLVSDANQLRNHDLDMNIHFAGSVSSRLGMWSVIECLLVVILSQGFFDIAVAVTLDDGFDSFSNCRTRIHAKESHSIRSEDPD